MPRLSRPTPTALNCIRNEPCGPCVALSKWDEKVSEAKDQDLLKKLQQDVTLARTQVNDAHDPLVQIPPEIASYIFSLYIRKGTYDTANPGLPRPLVLASICSKWRKIALAAPELWVSFDACCFQDWTFPLHLAQTWFARSRELPLNISLSWFWIGADCCQPDPSQIEDLLELICSQSNRWKNLTLDLPVATYSLFKSNSIIPNLEKLQLSSFPGAVGPFYPFNVRLHAKQLILQNIQPTMVLAHWEDITCMQISPISVAEALLLLQKCPRIEVLDLAFDKSWHDEPALTIPVALQHLLDLRCWVSIPDISPFFEGITTPALLCLEYAQVKEQGDLLSLEFMLTRSACSLTKLALRCYSTEGLDEHSIVNFIYSSQSLKMVTLHFIDPVFPKQCNFFQQILAASIVVSEEDTVPTFRARLPCLEVFRYYGPACFSWDTIATIYQNCSTGQTGQDEASGWLLNSFVILTPDPNSERDFIDRQSLLPFLKPPKNNFRMILNPRLLEDSMEYHHLTPDYDISLFHYCPAIVNS